VVVIIIVVVVALVVVITVITVVVAVVYAWSLQKHPSEIDYCIFVLAQCIAQTPFGATYRDNESSS
jgi:hypothetical protein